METKEAAGKEPAVGKKSGGFHYGYLIVLSFIMTSFGTLSLSLSCTGIFFPPTAMEFGVAPGIMSYYITIMWVACIISLPLMGKLVAKRDIRMVMTVAVIIMAAALLLQSITQAWWQYLLCGALTGVGLTVPLFLAPSTVVNRWFKKRSGFFIGLIMAFTGVGGVVWNAVGGALLVGIGWRLTLVVFAIIGLVLSLPFTLFVLRSYPADKGLQPVGSEEDDEAAPAAGADGAVDDEAVAASLPGMSAAEAFKSPSFILICILALLLNIGIFIYQLFASYIATLPIAVAWPTIGSLVMSVAMAGQTIGKIALGAAGDKSPLVATLFGVACGIVGLAAMALGGNVAWILFLAGGVYGICYALPNVMLPILTRAFYGVRDYSIIYSRISMAASIGGACAALIFGTITANFGYMPMFVLGIILVAASAAVVIAAVKVGLPAKWETEPEAEPIQAGEAE